MLTSADGGLLIAEATLIAEEAGGFNGPPGIYSAEQIESWKNITAAVHAKGGYIYSQLWALGCVNVTVPIPRTLSCELGALTAAASRIPTLFRLFSAPPPTPTGRAASAWK